MALMSGSSAGRACSSATRRPEGRIRRSYEPTALLYAPSAWLSPFPTLEKCSMNLPSRPMSSFASVAISWAFSASWCWRQ